jgi:calcineurin-like phosphoesterase family protein
MHLFGHSHGTLEPIGKSWDVGVDKNGYAPLSWDEIVEIMKNRPDNPNLVPARRNA